MKPRKGELWKVVVGRGEVCVMTVTRHAVAYVVTRGEKGRMPGKGAVGFLPLAEFTRLLKPLRRKP